MFNRTGMLLMMAVSFSTALFLFDVSDVSSKVSHPVGAACADCHLAGAGTTPENAHELLRDQESLCGSCHANALTIAHPSGFSPSRSLPDEYPLDWKGDVTCSTCHRVHAENHGLLRGNKRGKALCLTCHDRSFFSRMADTGMSIQQMGHLKASNEPLAVPLDSYSMHCLSCHNEDADDYNIAVDRKGNVRHDLSRLPHPVGVKYDEAIARGLKRNSKYRPRAMLRKEILLPDGMVSCVSCHAGYSTEHGNLVMSMNGSDLCYECHDR